ncbi:MAG TPA: (d)CMP kinase [Alphaproteobacteria bacterium]|nr:(d)CMP kinase [Alphaproteobacteria bacterium]
MIIVAVDGPAGAGKGTIACAIAKQLSFDHIDTGTYYRALALLCLRNDVNMNRLDEILKKGESLDRSILKSSDLRQEEVAQWASRIAVYPEVRQLLTRLIRKHAYESPYKGVVLDGRDVGSHIFPEAPCKLFITASCEERAQRRFLELKDKGAAFSYEDVLKEIQERDFRDINRAVDPLRPCENAFILDTSNLTIDESVKNASNFILKCYDRERVA